MSLSHPGDAISLPRQNNFDFLRLGLAVLVIWAHSDMLLTGRTDTDLFNRMVHEQLFSGSLAVYCFFIISGFLISQSWNRSKSAKDYFSKRVRRIYPGFVVASLATAFIFAPLGAESFRGYWHGFSLWKYLLNIGLLREPYLPPSFSQNPVHLSNGSLWSIHPEFLCYICIAVLGTAGLFKQRKRSILFVGVVLVAYWMNTLHFHNRLQWAPGIISIPLHMWLADFVYFCTGLVAAQYMRSAISDKTALLALLVTVIASQVPHGFLFILPFTLPVIVLWIAYTARLKMHDWAKKVNGDYSYGLYLYAYPIQQCLIKYVPSIRHVIPLACVSLVLTMFCAYLSWHWIESPFLRSREARMHKS